MLNYLPMLFVVSLSLAACEQRTILDPTPLDASQYAYYPLELGRYLEYQVDSVVFDFAPGGGTLRDSSTTLVREFVSDTFRNLAGELVYVIERYERANNNEPWNYLKSCAAIRTATQAIRIEDNLQYLKLVFPMDIRSDWNGNLWIDTQREIEIAGERIRPFTNWEYAVDSIDIQAFVGTFFFDSTLLVTEADDTNIIERRFSRARYAKHIGLAWREQWILDSQYCNDIPIPIDCETRPWEQKVEKGYLFRQKIIAFN
jgi:hypothetical protein